MKTPKVTVLMPVYNAERFLAEAIESILNQSFTDFEFLIINDGSADKSLGIIKKFAEKDQRIRLVSRENKGLVATLNEGLDLAKGEYIARQDNDDISMPTRLEKQIKYLESHPSTGLLGTNLKVIDAKGNPVPRDIADIDLLTSPDDLKLAEVFSNQFGHGSTMFRQETLKDTGTYDENFEMAEDYDLWTRFSHTAKVANLKEELYVWRLHQESMSKTAKNVLRVREVAFRIRDREFQYYLSHKLEYKLFSFHPLSMRGGLLAYLARKNSVYRNMALMYVYHGQRRRAVPALLFSILHAPWKKKSYRYLYIVLKDRQSALGLEYELY